MLAQILVNGKTVGGLDRNKAVSLSLPAVASDDAHGAHVTLDVLVEGLGRDNSGSKYDFKGLVSEHVLLDGEPHDHDPIPFQNMVLPRQRCDQVTTTWEGLINLDVLL